jgi:phage FluMu protein Com
MAARKPPSLSEARCENCGRLLCKLNGEATVEIRCPRCKVKNVVERTKPKIEPIADEAERQENAD